MKSSEGFSNSDCSTYRPRSILSPHGSYCCWEKIIKIVDDYERNSETTGSLRGCFCQNGSKNRYEFCSRLRNRSLFENMAVVKKLQASFPTYKDRFPVWAQQTSAMHQLAIWSMLEDVGFGASLQHYNPLIDKKVEEEWGINPDWELIAQMPFGVPLQLPENKADSSLEDKLIVFD